MVREIIEVKSGEYKLKISGEYMNKKIEILILPYDIDKQKKAKDIVLAGSVISPQVINPFV